MLVLLSNKCEFSLSHFPLEFNFFRQFLRSLSDGVTHWPKANLKAPERIRSIFLEKTAKKRNFQFPVDSFICSKCQSLKHGMNKRGSNQNPIYDVQPTLVGYNFLDQLLRWIEFRQTLLHGFQKIESLLDSLCKNNCELLSIRQSLEIKKWISGLIKKRLFFIQ